MKAFPPPKSVREFRHFAFLVPRACPLYNVGVSSKDEKAANLDAYVLEGLYPEAASVFTWQPEPLEGVKDHCVVVLDTNALVVPYTVSPKNLHQIGDTYQKLLAEDRLIVPGRVAREFARLRASKLADLHQKLADQMSKAVSLQADKYPLLESVTEYQSVLVLQKQINDSLKDYKAAIKETMARVLGWGQGDPVSKLYGRLFSEGAVLDPELDQEKTSEDLVHRQVHKLPPGYKDASKDDGGIGDLLIWQTILQIGEDLKKSVVFVTGDLKADWWHRGSGSVTLYPRHELVEEFRRRSGGLSFHIIKFADFLELYGADESVVQEARRGEVAQQQEDAASTRKHPRAGHARVVVTSGWWLHPVPNVDVLLGADNGTYQLGVTDENGVVTLPRPQQGRLTVLCAHDFHRGYVGHELYLNHDVELLLTEGDGVGSVMLREGAGHVPGLTGRLNPIHDTSGRYYIYAENIAIDGGRHQPVPFELGEPFTAEDAYGNQFELTVLEMVGRTALVEYDSVGST